MRALQKALTDAIKTNAELQLRLKEAVSGLELAKKENEDKDVAILELADVIDKMTAGKLSSQLD